MKKKNRGITLIALVITIIVLLILAGVSIATLGGENGIIGRAKNAKSQTEKQSAKERVQLEVIASIEQNGKIDIEKLNENLRNVEGLTYENQKLTDTYKIPSLPTTVKVDNYEVNIKDNGEIEISEKETPEEKSERDILLESYAQNGLVLHYDAVKNTQDGHDSASQIWYDLSGKGHNGTLNSATWTEDGLNFDGIDDYVSIGEMNYSNITLEVVIKINQFNAVPSVLISNAESGGYQLFARHPVMSPEKNAIAVCVGSEYKCVSAEEINSTSVLYSLSGNYNQSKVCFFENGRKTTLDASGEIKAPENSTIMLLGADPAGKSVAGCYFNGLIYSVRIYDRALTDEEVLSNYELDKKLYNVQDIN